MTRNGTAISRATLLRVAAFAILLPGLFASVRVDQKASRAAADVSDDVAAATPLAPDDSKRYGYQVGQLTGAPGLLLDRATRGVGWLLQGRPLAVLIAVGAFAAAGGLLYAADRASG